MFNYLLFGNVVKFKPMQQPMNEVFHNYLLLRKLFRAFKNGRLVEIY